MKIKVINRMLILLLTSMFFMLLTATDETYTYWGNINVLDQKTSSISIGSWNIGPDGISLYDSATPYYQNNLVWYNGQLWRYKGNYSLGLTPSNANGWIIYNDLSWYSTVIYLSGEIVYFNDSIYTSSSEHINQNPQTTGLNGPWTNYLANTITWTPGQTFTLNQTVYHNGVIWQFRNNSTTTEPGSTNQWSLLGDINFSLNYVYLNGDIVLYNGVYYTTTNGAAATGTIPGGNNSPWTVVSVPTFVNNVPNNTTYTLYNGILYRALQNITRKRRNIVPGSAASQGVWNAITTQEWQQYNTYTNGDLVMYQGNVYQLINSANSTNIPGTTANSWAGLPSLNYQASKVYSVNDYAVYNGNVYRVVNATNANLYAPGTFQNAWNQLNGYDWYWFNTYQAGSVVYYGNAIYISLQTTTNHQPDLPGSSIYWALYEN